MKRYVESFQLVELNRTFYQYPRLDTTRNWREKAPETFEFTVKTHQDISHKARMKVEEKSIQSFKYMKQICKTLKSKILLIQTPASFRPGRLQDAEKFFREIDREHLSLVWEPRGPAWQTAEVRKRLRSVLEKFDITHVTDPFKVIPVYTGEIAYFRLHGLGEQMYYYQHSNEELQKLEQLVGNYENEGKTVYVLFNNLSMFEDGIRLMQHLLKGTFPKITISTGLASIKEIVTKTRYPASKNMLIKKIGWRLVEVDGRKQTRLSMFLVNLPPKTYRNADELFQDIKSVTKLNA